ncbi:hypothetical protein C8R44DRAFT_734687 [Mycena epipterygia]|nr:hypothetical protein C8R44DRAFT_734687 [Mycena epipterygia]
MSLHEEAGVDKTSQRTFALNFIAQSHSLIFHLNKQLNQSRERHYFTITARVFQHPLLRHGVFPDPEYHGDKNRIPSESDSEICAHGGNPGQNLCRVADSQTRPPRAGPQIPRSNANSRSDTDPTSISGNPRLDPCIARCADATSMRTEVEGPAKTKTRGPYEARRPYGNEA